MLAGLPFARCYIDDIIIWSSSFAEHLEHLDIVLRRLREWGLKIILGKCLFGAEEVDFLGHRVIRFGIRPQLEKTQAIRDMQTPFDLSGLRALLGLFSYSRKFVPALSTIAAPLNRLLKKDSPWRWGEVEQAVVDHLKRLLCSDPVQRRPDYAKPFRLQTDWSVDGVGAVLSQLDERGQEFVVAYASKSSNSAEQNYSSYNGESLAVV